MTEKFVVISVRMSKNIG